jgi:peptidoglycan/xylan/chitin deacetylase (PgdA/CDA1 family)
VITPLRSALRLRPLIAAFFLCASLSTAAAQGQATESQAHGAPLTKRSAVVSVYHHVSEQTPASTSLSPARFEQHLAHLRDTGYAILPLPALLDALAYGTELADNAVAITFDDGYESIYENAFPLLQAYDYPFTLFVSTGPIDRGQAGYLTWDEIREMVAAGVSVGNHGTEHASLIDLDSAAMREDIEAAQQRIDAELGTQPKLFAYPYGEYNPEAKALLAELGYRGLAQNSGAIGRHSDPQALPRFPLAGLYSELEGVKQKYATLAFDVTRSAQESPISTLDAPRSTLQFAPSEDYDLSSINCFDGGVAIALEWSEATTGLVTLMPTARDRGRRWHYICTARQRGKQRYYWYSVPWFDPSQPQ